MNASIPKLLIFTGTLILLIGAISYFFGHKLTWIGRLPGDIRIERENFRFYFPITTLVILNVIIWLVIRLLKK